MAVNRERNSVPGVLAGSRRQSTRAMVWRLSATICLSLLLVACAGKPPVQLGEMIPDAPSPGEVHASPERYVGREVLWGGEIIAVANEAASTDIEVYARPLSDNAEPRPDGGDEVRFVARLSRFVDPVAYAPGKRLSVRGTLAEPVTRPIGEFPYRYPLVEVAADALWPVWEPPPEPSWYRDPFYDPWGPWGPWGPYRRWPYYW
jgi:outer membrane lipoprotein